MNQHVFEHVIGRETKAIGWVGDEVKDPKEDMEFARGIGMDAVVADFIYRPGNVVEKSRDGEEHYSTGTIKGWSDLSILDIPPSLKEIDDKARRYADASPGN